MQRSVPRPGPGLLALLLALVLGCSKDAAPTPRVIVTDPVPAAQPAPAPKAALAAVKADGLAAYERKDFTACADLLARAGDHYDSACCHALAGNPDGAFAELALEIAGGAFKDVAHLKQDSDLASLHADPRWSKAVAELEAKVAAYRATVNPELLQIHDEDQGDRMQQPIDWAKVTPRDQARREQVATIVANGGAKVADDYYHAAMVYQHGDTVDDIRRANELARKAVELQPDHAQARWLVAASADRVLMREGKPQKYATQFTKKDANDPWILYEVDPSVTDAERAEWNVPPLAAAQARVTAMNAAEQAATAKPAP